jgi:hypothetical protein
MMKAVRRYLENVVAGLSHLINALTGGDARVSWSARLGAEAHNGNVLSAVLALIIDTVLFSRGHCYEHAKEEGLI